MTITWTKINRPEVHTCFICLKNPIPVHCHADSHGKGSREMKDQNEEDKGGPRFKTESLSSSPLPTTFFLVPIPPAITSGSF